MEKLNIAAIKPNEENPRFITDAKFKKLVKSIKDFPEMLEVRPLVIDEDNIVLGGNMRLKALKAAGVFEIPVKRVVGWTEQQKKEFIIKDNIGYGEWDWDIIANEWNSEQLTDWGLDVPDFAVEPEFDELTEDFEKTEFSIKITFKTIEDLQKAENDIQELIDRKYKDAFFSVKGGII
jgi:ParB-like chromosome segregation protein Spo0J